jgi:hypothetical protein
VNVTLVELVEDDRSDIRKQRIFEHPTNQQRFGHKANFGFRACNRLKSNVKSNALSEWLLELLGNATGGHASRDSSRFENHDFLATQQA